MKSLLEIKQALYAQCVVLIDEKIERARSGMKAAQEAANGESKCSAGDKYETGRAMMHIEKDKRAMQLVEVAKMKKALDMINPKQELSEIKLGSLVKTAQASYFLSVSIGALQVGDESYFAISPVTPIGKLVFGLKKGDNFSFNGNEMLITACV